MPSSAADAGLLAASLGLAHASAGLALLLGGGSALALGRDRGGCFAATALLWALSLATGPGLWAALASRLAWLHGGAGSVYVAAGAYGPLAFAALASVRTALDPAVEESARLSLGHARAAWRVTLPLMGGVALAAALLIAVLVFGDAAIPSAMGTRASASEALAAVSLGAAPLDAVARGLPGIVAAVALAMLVLPLAGGAVPVFTSAPASARVTAWRRALAILLTAVAVAPPLAAGLGSLSSDSLALPDVAGPLATSVAGALPVAIGAVALGSLLSGLGPRPLAALAVVALAVPPPLAASLALGVLTLAAPQLRESTAAFTLVSTLRLAPLAALVIATVAARRPPSWFEAARLAGLPRWRTLAGISVPSLAGPALAAAAVAFLLSFHDVVLALMLDPPGHDRLGPAVFSRLGVGSPSTTALLALTPAAAVALATGAALVARRGRRA